MPSFRGQVVNGQILLTVHVARPGVGDPSGEMISATALLDTGATISGISERVVGELELAQTEQWETIVGVHGQEDVPLYEIDMMLPISDHQQTFSRGIQNMKVIPLSVAAGNFDVLLGMDLLYGFHLTLHGDLFILSN